MLNVFTSHNQLPGFRSTECLQFDLPRVGVYPCRYDEGREGPGSLGSMQGSKIKVYHFYDESEDGKTGRRNNLSKHIQGSKNMVCS